MIPIGSKLLSSFCPLLAATFILSGCGGSSDSEKSGYINLYNASANAPAVFLTLDENLDEDDDDEFETTYYGVEYADSSGNYEVEAQDYFMELAWQDEYSTDRNDLQVFSLSEIDISDEVIRYVVITEDIANANILEFDVPVIDEDDDTTNELFNFRLLNVHPNTESVDVYQSNTEQTFNEATLISQVAYGELTENFKYSQDDYIFYITAAGSEEVLYQSDEVPYDYPAQYIMAIRGNPGVDSSPFIIDKISSSNIVSYEHDGAKAQFQVFNAIKPHELLPDYQSSFDFHLDGVTETAEITALPINQFSDDFIREHGDYSVALTVPDTETILLKNHLVTLSENQEKTIFFYLLEEDVDHDGDGDVDEDGDGIVDEIEVNAKSLVVNNSTSESIYDNDIKIVHFVDNEDFSSIKFYFVRHDETIETANYQRTVSLAKDEEITLLNNTYTVFAVANDDGSDLILASTEITITDASNNQFVILDQDPTSPSGYLMIIADQ